MTTPTIRHRDGSLRRLWQQPDIRRLGVCLAAGIVVALMTGKSGSNSNPTGGFTGSLGRPRVLIFLGLGLAAWGLSLVWQSNRDTIQTSLSGWSTTISETTARRSVRYPSYAGLLALAIVIPLVVSTFWQQVAVDDVGIYVLLALGLNVVVGFAGLLDLGYIAFYAIGAYVTAYFAGSLPVAPPFQLNLFWVFPLGVIAAIIAGVILGAPTLRLRGDYLAIVTLGFGEIIDIVANNLNGITGGPTGTAPVPHFAIHIGGLNYVWTLAQLPYYYLLLALVILVIVAFTLLENSRVGRAWVAIREDEVAAEACGINTLKYKVMAFAIGASTSGLAGVLFAGKNSFFSPQVFTVQLSILVLVYVIFGGMGSIVGVIVGAALLGWLQQELRNVIQPQDLYVYIGALLVAMMIFRPQGVVPSRRRSREIALAEAGVGGADAVSASAAP